MKSYRSLTGFGIIIIIITMGFSGCDTPQPLSAIPNVILYYANNETRVFVSGEDYRYESINITINNDTKMDHFIYGLTSRTNNTDFRLDIRVVDDHDEEDREDFIIYIYNASIMLKVDEDEVIFYLTDTHYKNEVKRESPYKTLMEKE